MKTVILLLSLALPAIATASNEVVTIECRQVEVPRAEANKLITGATYTLNAEQLRTINDWVGQKKARILAQPRVSTISGAQAQVRAVREYLLVHTAIPLSICSVVPVFPTREVGKIFNVTPTICPDGSIALTLVPETSKTGPTKEFRYYRSRDQTELGNGQFGCVNQQTSIVVQNGATVLFGVADPQLPAAPDRVVLFLLSATVHKLE